MRFSLSSNKIHAIVLDVEGTTTPISFVYDVLFPYARRELHEFLQSHFEDPEVQEAIRALKVEHDDDAQKNLEPPLWNDGPAQRIHSAETYVIGLMTLDRKSFGLKQLQGKIWQEGYRREEIRGQVFADVPPAFQRWHDRKLDIRIYSSGSELAQRLLFGSTNSGDLTPYLKGYFDTRIGAKTEDKSYKQIAEACQLKPHQIIFVSDMTRELDAAHRAEMKTLLCLRPGNQPQIIHDHATISTFDDIGD